MTPLKIAAIAITLIIAVPIVLGYGLASEETEVEKNVVTSTSNISDILLNSESDYYMDYNGGSNNSYIITNNMGNPDYVTVSSNPTSMPVYTSSTTTNRLSYNPSNTTTTGSVTSDTLSQPIFNTEYTEWVQDPGLNDYSGTGQTAFQLDPYYDSIPEGTTTNYVLFDHNPVQMFSWTLPTGVGATGYLSYRTDGMEMHDAGSASYTTLSQTGNFYLVQTGTMFNSNSDEVNVYQISFVDPEDRNILSTITDVTTIYIHYTLTNTADFTTVGSAEIISAVGNYITHDLIYEVPYLMQEQNGQYVPYYANGALTITYPGGMLVYQPDTNDARYIYVNPTNHRLTVLDEDYNQLSQVYINAVPGWAKISYLMNFNDSPKADSDEITIKFAAIKTFDSSNVEDLADLIVTGTANFHWMNVVLECYQGVGGVNETIILSNLTSWDSNNFKISNNGDGTLYCKYWNISTSQYEYYPKVMEATIVIFGDTGCGYTSSTSPTTVSMMFGDTWSSSFTEGKFISISVTHADGTTVWNGYPGLTVPSIYYYNHHTLTTDMGIYRGVTDIQYGSLTYYANGIEYALITNTATGQYIDPADGWMIPPVGGAAQDGTWVNSYSNNYIRMMMKVSGFTNTPGAVNVGYEFTILGDDDAIMRINQTTTGVTSVVTDTATSLGEYNYLMLEFNVKEDTVTVNGIREWPTLGMYPTTYNKIVIPYDFSGDISAIQIESVGDAVASGNRAHFRVDTAAIVAGQFPSTKDYYLDLWEMYPDSEHERVYINSIGVYGDYFNLGGVMREIQNGKINFTDADTGLACTAPLLGIQIDMVDSEEWEEYVTYVNGHRVANSESTPKIGFVGEWSLTALRSEVQTETITEDRWVPGEFVLDKNGFVLAMVITAVAAFVVLGMSGARSGAKVGLLALICGGACAVGFMII